ncbi:MAG TPA: serine hydrolase domain-containing protein [Puia sp.]|nr:serine hydrolase domain-containing protein [Puia sp.]
MKACVHLIFAVFLITTISCGQAAQPPKTVQKADSIPPSAPALNATELRRYSGIAGHFLDSLAGGRFNGSMLVAKNGVIVYERYKGFKYLDKKKDSLDQHTAFHLASVSKTFTAMATLKLWQEGKLDIHDPVAKYLAGFPTEATTIQMLLSHRSGLRNYVHFMDRSGWDKRKFLSNNDVLQYIIAHPRDVQGPPPGKHFEYSNTNYALLALIIEKVSGLSYSDYLSKTFFQPLQMEDTHVFKTGDSATAMESFYQTGRKFRVEFLDQVYGDKNVFSTVRDLYKWDQGLRSGQLFTKGVMDSAYAPYSFEKPGKRNYGLGWRMLLIPNGKKLIYHNGWWHGNRTVFVRMLDENATIIALCNNDYKRVYSAKKLCDLFGDYRQGNENFEEGENESAGPGGEPQNPTATTPAATAPAVAGPVPPNTAPAATTATATKRTVHHRRRIHHKISKPHPQN